MRRNTLIAGVTALAAATSVFAVPTAASAAGCSRGAVEYTGYRQPNTYQTFIKSSSSGCRDLNVTETGAPADNERYAGFYKKDGRWVIGSRGYVPIKDGEQSPWVVLLSDVRGGTEMGVGTYRQAGAFVWLAY